MPTSLSSNNLVLERKREWKVIRVIGIAHACSHFYQLFIPTLYVFLAAEFGYDFARLGWLAAAFFIASGIGQASSGFLVDRMRPVYVLHFGLTCFVVSALLVASAQHYWVLITAAILGGVGNSIFHPVDYSILNQKISAHRLGHAYSTHGLTGNLGWALTPILVTTLSKAYGWRSAAVVVALLIAVVLLLTIYNRFLLGASDAPAVQKTTTSQPSSATSGVGLSDSDLSSATAWQAFCRIMALPTLWGAFLFFLFSSMALASVQNFTIPMLDKVYALSSVWSGSALSAYMLASAVGVFLGGFLAGADRRSEYIVFASLIAAGLALLLLAAGFQLSYGAVAIVAVAGLCSGVASPSRDMLIRRVTPKGATATVYGLVYSGMDVGAAIAPPVFGALLDQGVGRGPWVGAALAFMVAAVMATWVAHKAR